MSKKRNKNNRNKLLKARDLTAIKHSRKNNILNELGYVITEEPIDDADVRDLPLDVQTQMEELFIKVQSKPKGTVKELVELTNEYPYIPQFFNYLYAAYMNTGDKDKAIEVMKSNYSNNPDYLFSRLNYSDYLVENGQFDGVDEIYNGKYSLKELYPDRQVFHISEVVSFYGVIGYYYAAIGKEHKALHCLSVLNSLSPNHGYTLRLADKIKPSGTLIA
jgi:tetratricopeptide (TPR) repeat protein